jgi:hypothetical protein
MSLNHRQQRQLRRIESRLLQSDPQLAAKLDVFGKLSAGQRLPAWEQIVTRLDRVRALITATFLGGKARQPQPARQPTGPATT